MKSAPINYQLDPEMQEELTLAESRRQAKDMACIKYCGDGLKVKGTIHQIQCPYWDPFRKKNTIENGSKGGEQNGNSHR